jgi:RecA/RadA recombinase
MTKKQKKKKKSKAKAKAKKNKKAKKKTASKGAASSPPAIRTHKDLVDNVADLAAEFTGDHKGAEAVVGGSTLLDSLVTTWIPTGDPVFDAMLQGGFPGGRVTQLFGLESTGKSTHLYGGMIQCTKMGGVSILIDPELSFDPDRFRRMGGDPDAVILLQKAYSGNKRDVTEKKQKNAQAKGLPAITVQDVFRYLYDILDSIAAKPQWKDRPVLVGLDSLDNISTDEAINGDKGGMTLKPRLIREGFRKITAPVAKSNAAFVIISQTIENISTGGFGPKTTTAGGGGPKFISSIRINTKKLWVERDGVDVYTRTPKSEGHRPTGNSLVSATTVKNKLNRPFLTAITAINNDSGQALEGSDPAFSLLYFLYEDLIVTKPGVAFRYLKVDLISPEVAEAAKVAGLEEGIEYPFTVSKWREFLIKYPGVPGYLMAYVQAKFKRPDMYVPEDESQADAPTDATKDADQS